MKVLVTGATGLVGAHSALALLQAGHKVRLLVRNPDAARTYFSAHGFALDDVVAGDVRDRDGARRAIDGCDAVLHAAAMVSLDPRKASEIIENNLSGVQAVVGSACEMEVPNVVYVSSLEVFAQHGRASIDETAPLGTSKLAYSTSKRQCETYVRSLQQQGHPVQITYPAGVLGPDDPKLSEANRGLTTMLGTVPLTSTGLQFVDARDLALAHRWLLEHPVTRDVEGARYIVGGNYKTWAEIHAALQAATGRKIPSPRVPGALLRGIGHAIDVAKAIVPFDTQLSSDAMAVATQWTPAESTRFLARSGLAFRPAEETLADTIRWLARAGHIDARRAGRLAA